MPYGQPSASRETFETKTTALRRQGATGLSSSHWVPLLVAGLGGMAIAAQAGEPVAIEELGTIEVQAESERSGKLRAQATRIGKQEQDPQEVPQSLSSITETLLHQQQVSTLRDALHNVPGISFNAAEGGRSGDNSNVRSFYTFGDMYLDGMRDTAQYHRETFNLEQIDVLRGAGAMLFGRGQAGAVINQVSKRAHAEEMATLGATLGSDAHRALSADINKPISESSALRINAFRRDEGSWRVNPATGARPELHRAGIAASLALNQSSDSKFWIDYAGTQTGDNPDYGVAFDAATRAPSQAFPASTYYGTPKSFDISENHVATLVSEVRLDGERSVRSQLRRASYDRSYWAKTPSASAAPDLAGAVGGNKTRLQHYRTLNLQSDYQHRLRNGSVTHQLLTGAEYLREENYRNYLQNFGSLSEPDFRAYQESTSGLVRSFKGDSYALYLQDTLEFLSYWRLTAGLRRDQLDARYSSTTSPELHYGENSRRAALSFHPALDAHFYLAWSDSFSPTADLYQLSRAAYPPERSDVTELGFKLALMDGDLALRGALYQANKYWERNSDLESTASVLTRKRRTHGLELELSGQLTPRLEIAGGLALMDARILEVAENFNDKSGLVVAGNPEYAGQVARNSPPFTFNLWASYQLDGQWSIAGGLESKGARQAFNPTRADPVPTLDGAYHPNTAPSYTRWDAMLAYETHAWRVQLNVRNLFDTLYYDAVYENGGMTVPGARRSVLLSAEYRF